MEPLVSLIITTILCLSLAFWAISLKRQNTVIATSLKAKEAELLDLQTEFDELEKKVTLLSDFDTTMSETGVTTKLQTTRNVNHQNSTTPEKYQYIISLTQKGMKAEEIASILSISEHEARQLVSLARISASPQQVS